MIKNIVFDMGMVLVEFDWKSYLNSLGFSEEIKTTMIKEALGNQDVWNEHDRGILDDEEFIAMASKNASDIEGPLRIYMKNVGKIITEYEYSKEWLHSLKERGYHIYILSNYGKTPFKYAKEHFTYFGEVDEMVISSDVKMVKPEPGIYKYLLDTYELKPKETVFLDDRKDNIDMAKSFGMKGIVFENYQQGKKELETLLN